MIGKVSSGLTVIVPAPPPSPVPLVLTVNEHGGLRLAMNDTTPAELLTLSMYAARAVRSPLPLAVSSAFASVACCVARLVLVAGLPPVRVVVIAIGVMLVSLGVIVVTYVPFVAVPAIVTSHPLPSVHSKRAGSAVPAAAPASTLRRRRYGRNCLLVLLIVVMDHAAVAVRLG